jgi:two-component system LytT family sensor kinase
MSNSVSYIFKKYKIFYVIAWMMISFILMFVSYDYRTPMFPQWVGYLIVTGLAIPVCYYSANTFTPRYLYQRRILRFIGILILAAVVNAALTEVIALLIYSALSGNPPFRSAIYVFALFYQMILIDTILIIVSCIVKIITDRYFMEQQMLEIEKEKISTELNFLRSQVNPHFLFNVMNTIYFQIDRENTDARESVEKLSEMLRYQLYECTTDKIQIHKELNYIQNYVAIQTLRMEKETDIRLFIEKEMDTFNNTYDQANGQQHILQSGGLGMQNLKRRLELLYPNNHELIINKTPDTYQAILKLQYND